MLTLEQQEKAFDEYIKRENGIGRLNTESLNVDMQLFFDALKDNVRYTINFVHQSEDVASTNRMPPFHFDLIDNLSFNGQAMVDEQGNEFIGITHGAVLILFDLFNRILARTDTFPEIGDPTVEVNPSPLPFLSLSYSDLLIFYNTNEIDIFLTPIDPLRKQFATLLTEFAVYFLVEHELGHLVLGHNHYIKAKTGKSFIAEFDSSEDVILEDLTLQVIEWNADNYSSTQATYRLNQRIMHNHSLGNFNDAMGLSETRAFAYWSFSIWIMFRLMQTIREKTRKKSSNAYPTIAQRMSSALYVEEKVVNTYATKFNFTHIFDILSENIISAEAALSKISNDNLIPFALADIYQPSVKFSERGNNKIFIEYNETILKPALRSYTRSITELQ